MMEITTVTTVAIKGIIPLIALVWTTIYGIKALIDKDWGFMILQAFFCIVLMVMIVIDGCGWTVTTTDIVPIEYAFEEDANWTGLHL